MQLKNISLTGADHTVEVDLLIEAMCHTEHVDFGILFSPTRPANRYPTDTWLNQLTDAHASAYSQIESALYAHICGKWVTSLLQGEGDFIDENAVCHRDGKNFAAFTGFQLNIGKRVIEESQITAFIDIIKDAQLADKEWIIQIQVKRQNAFVQALRDAGMNANPLYDKSGGKGIEPKTWVKPGISGYVGYAGGLSAYNWFTVAQQLCAHENEQPFWLDMESSLRHPKTDRFDLRPVHQIIDQVKTMRENGMLFYDTV